MGNHTTAPLEIVTFDPDDFDTYPSVCHDSGEVAERFGFTGGERLVFDGRGSYLGQLVKTLDDPPPDEPVISWRLGVVQVTTSESECVVVAHEGDDLVVTRHGMGIPETGRVVYRERLGPDEIGREVPS